MLSRILTLVFTFLTFCSCETIVSEFKIHLFRGTFEKLLDQNSYLLEDFMKFPIGRHRIGRNELTDTRLEITPMQVNGSYNPSKVVFNEGEGIEVTFHDLHFDGEGKVGSKIGVFFGNLKILRLHFRFAAPVADQHLVDLIPDLRVEKVYTEFYDQHMGFTMDGKTLDAPGIKAHIRDWVRNAVDSQASTLRDRFYELHLFTANWIASKVNLNKFDGRVRLAKIYFYDNYADISIKFEFPKHPGSDLKTKTGRFKDQHMPNQQGIELIFDENIVNTFLYAIYNIDPKFSMRNDLGWILETYPDFEYYFYSQKLFYPWKETYGVYGWNKTVDTVCSLGKSLSKITGESTPPHIHFFDKNTVNVTFNLHCDILVEKKPGKWDLWRTVFVPFYFELFVDFDYSKAGTKVTNNGFIKNMRIDPVFVIKDGNVVYNELEQVLEFFRQAMSKLRYFVNKGITGYKFKLPGLNECNSIMLKNTKASIYSEFFVLSSNFKLTRKGATCAAPQISAKAHEHAEPEQEEPEEPEHMEDL